MDEINNQPMQSAPAPQKGGMGKMILWIIIAVLIIGAVAYFATRSSKQAQDTQNATDTRTADRQSMAKEQPVAKTQSLKDLLSSGISQQCDFSSQTETSKSTGSVFISGGKMRGSFDSVSSAKEVKTNMINDGQNVYIWMDGQSTGYKMSATTMMDNTTPNPAIKQGESVDPNSKYNYNCTPKTIDSPEFNLPSGITFNDVAAMMKLNAGTSTASTTVSGSASAGASANSNQCAACSQVPAAQQAQCKAALGCK